MHIHTTNHLQNPLTTKQQKNCKIVSNRRTKYIQHKLTRCKKILNETVLPLFLFFFKSNPKKRVFKHNKKSCVSWMNPIQPLFQNYNGLHISKYG